MLAADLLLYWVSHHGKVSDHLMKTAQEGLARRFGLGDDGGRRVANGLYRLGHVERPGDSDWAVVPPTIVHVRDKPESGYLCGARAPNLLEVLQNCSVTVRPVVDPPIGPQRWEIEGAVPELEEAARQVGATVVPDRSLDLLRALPDIRTAIRAIETCSFPTQAVETRDAIGNDGWSPATWTRHSGAPTIDGIYRDVGTQAYQWWVEDGQCRALRTREERAVAFWFTIARTRRMRMEYKRAHRTLHVPRVGHYVPVLVERALCLPSGFLPEPMAASSSYANLSLEHAREAARILCLELTVS